MRHIEPGGLTKFSALGVEAQRVWVVLDLVDPPAEARRLGDAYRVHVRFLLRESPEDLRAPVSATFRRDGGHAVFHIEGTRIRRVPVELGLSGGGWAVIRAGLAAGESVVVHADRDLEDGACGCGEAGPELSSRE